MSFNPCACSAQFANLRNFEIARHKLEIVKLQANFEIAQPSLRDFEIAVHKLETVKLRSAVSEVNVYRNVHVRKADLYPSVNPKICV